MFMPEVGSGSGMWVCLSVLSVLSHLSVITARHGVVDGENQVGWGGARFRLSSFLGAPLFPPLPLPRLGYFEGEGLVEFTHSRREGRGYSTGPVPPGPGLAGKEGNRYIGKDGGRRKEKPET